jgi:AraC-like DNA-binding protein
MAEPTVAAGFAKALLDLAVSKGASRQALLKRSQIDPDDLADQDNRISLNNYLALMKAGVELCNEPALALQFGEAFSMPQLSIVGLIGQSVETVAEGFAQMNRYVRLMIDAGEGGTADWFQMTRDDDGVWMALTSNIYIEHPALTESAFARCVCRHDRNIIIKPFAKAVHFTHVQPDYHAEYDRIFQMPVVFGSDKNALLIDESFMSIKLPPTSRYVFGILSERADVLLKSLENSKTVKGQVESLLIPILHTGELSMELIASKLGLGRQTLYRKLKAEGVSYEKLLDELRHQMALHYLGGKKVSVNEAAYLVGFSDPSAFSRAFKRWTGASPGMSTIRQNTDVN